MALPRPKRWEAEKRQIPRKRRRSYFIPYEERDIAFKCRGKLATEPKGGFSSSGLLKVRFTIWHQPARRMRPILFGFICYDEQVARYIMENFRKGDEIFILCSTPWMPATQRLPPVFSVWDIAPKGEPYEPE